MAIAISMVNLKSQKRTGKATHIESQIAPKIGDSRVRDLKRTKRNYINNNLPLCIRYYSPVPYDRDPDAFITS